MTNPPQAEFPGSNAIIALSLVAWLEAVAAIVVLSPFILASEGVDALRRRFSKPNPKP